MLGVSFVLCDVAQRLVIGPWIRLVPRHRVPVLTRWEQFLAWLVLSTVSRIGGAGIPRVPALPATPDTLVLMNHQSLLDIPLVVSALEDRYPRIVTRKRYSRGIPLIAHMVRLFEYPLVDPEASPAEARKMLAAVREAARDTDVPLALFPEGTRTRDGEIGEFQRAGAKLILRQRPWTVWVVVADGFWQRARLDDFLEGMADIRGTVGVRGPFEWTDPRGDADDFLERMRQEMIDELARMRAAEPA